jgi:translation initiation factor 2 beta subunit (eIF-2beta)/eIF-5
MDESWVDSLELRFAMFSVVSNNWQDILKFLKQESYAVEYLQKAIETKANCDKLHNRLQKI